jgi:S1-C subfamily serine protease
MPSALTPGIEQNVPDEDQGPNIEDFPGFKDFPRINTPDQIPNRTDRPRLGVEVGNVDDSNQKIHEIPDGVKGAVVNSVMPNSPAERAGLEVGDVVMELDGKKIDDAATLVDAMKAVKRGDTKRIKYVRFSQGARAEFERSVRF